MDDLDDSDADYDFSVFGEVTEDDESFPADMTDDIPKVAVDLTRNHLDRVVMVIGDDSIFTLENGTFNQFIHRIIGATVGIHRIIAARPGRSPRSGVNLSD